MNRELMEIEKWDKVFFEPHIGGKYFDFKGTKLLILGESHYCGDCKENDEVCRKCTKDVLEEKYLEYKKSGKGHVRWMNTFTRFTNILFGEKISGEKLLKFWDSVIFYNYVQSSVEKSRTQPTEEQFKNSKDAFEEILTKCKPNLILVWGRRSWDNLDNSLENDNRFEIFWIYHPSSPKYYNKDYFKKKLEKEQRLKELLDNFINNPFSNL